MKFSCKYKLKGDNKPLIDALKDKFSFSDVFSNLLSKRIDNIESAKYFIKNNLFLLHSPFHFCSMKPCIERIDRAIKDKERIYIFTDRDADGITSCALMYYFLSKKGLDVSVFVPSLEEPYGFSEKNYDKAIKNKASLVITTDVGITKIKEIEYAKKHNIDTIVLDHHEPLEQVPDCIIINPKCKKSGYPFFEISASAVVSKVIWAYEFSKTAEYEKEYCLFVSIKNKDTLRVQYSFISNFVRTFTRNKVFNCEDEFLKSDIFQELSRKKIIIFKKENLERFFNEPIELCGYTESIMKKKYADLESIIDENKFLSDSIEALEFLYKSFVFRKNSNISSNFIKVLDLVSISTIADVMPLIDENRIMTAIGIDEINKRQRVNIQGLLSAPSLIGASVTSRDIAYTIAPLINSAGRMGKSEVALKVFTEDDNDIIDIYTRELLSLNSERQEVKNNIYRKIKNNIEQYIPKGRKFIFVDSQSIPRGIISLISSSLCQEYGLSCIVLSKACDKIIGSIRTVGDVDSTVALSFAKHILGDYGGHKRAGGFELKSKKDIPEFKKIIAQYIDSVDDYRQDSSIAIDMVFDSKDFTKEVIDAYIQLSPFGNENPNPTFLLKNVKIKNCEKFLGKNDSLHAKFLFSCGIDIKGIFWNNGEVVDSIQKDMRVDIIVNIESNYFRGSKEYRLNIIDMEF